MAAGNLTPQAHEWASRQVADRVAERATREDWQRFEQEARESQSESQAEAARSHADAALEEFRKSQDGTEGT